MKLVTIRRGAAGQQYAIIIGLIAVVAIIAIMRVGSSVSALMTRTGNTLSNVVGSTGSGTSEAGGGGGGNCATARTSCQAHLTAGCSASGGYPVDPDGAGPLAQNTLYCDMASDGGGWTLVYKNAGPTGLIHDTVAEQGAVSCLAHANDTCSSKVSDAYINAVGGTGGASTLAGYRVTSPNIANRYYFPKGCVYTHDSCNNTYGSVSGTGACAPANTTYCLRYSASYATSPSYTQCANWGGRSAGLNAWYQCNGNGNYTNVVVTARLNSNNNTQRAGITTNASGAILGSDSVDYGNSVYMWVR